MADLVPSSVLEGSIDLIRRAGRDPVEFVLSVGLPLEALHSPHTLISSIAFSRLLEMAAKELDERFFGLKVSKIQGLDSSGSLWLVARNARTVGEELVLLAENMALHTGLVSATVAAEIPVGKLVTVNFHTPISAKSLALKQQIRQVQVIELFFGAAVSELRRSLGKQWQPDYVQFMHAAPDDMQPYREMFGERIFFDQDVNAFQITNEDFDHPTYRTASGVVSADGLALIKRESELRAVYTTTFVERVRRIIRILIDREGCTADTVAHELGLPTRTLRYRLAQKNTSYQVIYDESRLQLARHYLLNSELGISAIAERLHFTDSAAFANFFKRQTGLTPRGFRNRTR
ncbi:MAG: helix-turn-helix domain-containing protein [Proteobacteria bacterium]|nr:helix-turn-helix domain-containing protein [Pseudomonadota bacterium]